MADGTPVSGAPGGDAATERESATGAIYGRSTGAGGTTVSILTADSDIIGRYIHDVISWTFYGSPFGFGRSIVDVGTHANDVRKASR